MPRILAIVLAANLFACQSANTAPIEPAAAPSAQKDSASTVVAKWDGGQITLGELESELEGELRAMEVEYKLNRYERLNQALSGKLDQALLEAAAKKAGAPDVDTLMAAEIEAKTPPPTDAEIDAFYPMVRDQLRGASLEEARPIIRNELHRRAMSERFQTYITELRASSGAELSFPYPDLPRAEIPVVDHDPVLGAADAPVTIVQFAEYQCYYCAKASPTLKQLLADYDGKVKLVFKDYPLPGHSQARPSAVAAHCAGDQDKYWPMNEVLLSNQQALSRSDLVGYAERLALDVPAFEACLDSGKFEAALDEDMAHGQKVGVQATPTFFINGMLLSGAQPYERFAAVIDKELEN